MSAIQTIIETYLRFSDERALLALKAHRLKLLAGIEAKDPFAQNLRDQCTEEVSAIENGLARLRPPVPSVPDGGTSESISSGADHRALASSETEPIASETGDDAVVVEASEVSANDQRTNALPAPSPEPLKPRPAAARLSDPSLIAGSLLAASLATGEPDGTKAAADLVTLQQWLTRRIKG